jgi:hypothetical protein
MQLHTSIMHKTHPAPIPDSGYITDKSDHRGILHRVEHGHTCEEAHLIKKRHVVFHRRHPGHKKHHLCSKCRKLFHIMEVHE